MFFYLCSGRFQGSTLSRCPLGDRRTGWRRGHNSECLAVLKVSADAWDLYPDLGVCGMVIKWLPREFIEFLVRYICCQKFAHVRGDASTSGGERCHVEVTISASWAVLWTGNHPQMAQCKRHRSRNNVARKMRHFGKPDIRETRN